MEKVIGAKHILNKKPPSNMATPQESIVSLLSGKYNLN